MTTTYTYDYANRLLITQSPDYLITYSYDGYGRRVKRSVKVKGLSIPESEYTGYLGDGSNVFLEFPGDGRTRNPIEYIYGNGQLVMRDDLLRLMKANKIVHQDTQYFHYDGLGSTVNLTDEKGSVTMSYEYDAFGKVMKEENGVGWKGNNYKFVGGYGVQDDSACGLQYMRNRYYDPSIGRFITKDPILEINPIAKISPIVPKELAIFFPTSAPPFIKINPQVVIFSKDPLIQLYFQYQNSLSRRLITETTTIYIMPLFMLYVPQTFHSYIYSQNNPISYIDPAGYSLLCEVICAVLCVLGCVYFTKHPPLCSLICTAFCWFLCPEEMDAKEICKE